MSSDNTLFFDVETTGLDRSYDDLTTAVWLYNGEWKKYVKGEGISQFQVDWNEAEEVCSYNGKWFDEAFVCREFEVFKHRNHTDLRAILQFQKKITGGLKKISINQGIERPEIIDNADGFDAVHWWAKYKSGDIQALETLLYYNAWDVKITAELYNKFVQPINVKKPPFTCDYKWVKAYLENLPYKKYKLERTSPSQKKPIIDPYKKLYRDYLGSQIINKNGPRYKDVVCFTGTLLSREGERVNRKKEAWPIANKAGFLCVENPINGCTHLVVGDLAATSNKQRTAREKNITVLSAEEFWTLLDLKNEDN